MDQKLLIHEYLKITFLFKFRSVSKLNVKGVK